MTRDYYDILGIPLGSDAKTIKRAYYRLAKEFHPDVNDAPDAGERFKEINDAYQVLIALASGEDTPKVRAARARAQETAVPDYVAIYLRAYEMFQQDLYGPAIMEFDRVLAIKPDYASAYEYRGRCYRQLKQYQQAFSDLNRAVELDPENAFAIRERGNVRCSLKDYEGAIADAEDALRLFPRMASAYNLLHMVYFGLGDYRKAIEAIAAAIEISPDHGPYYYNRGLVYSAMRQFETSVAEYTQAIRLDPDNVDNYKNRGNDHLLSGHFEKALADFDAAIRLAPEEHLLYNNRGNVYIRAGKYAEALADLDMVIKIDPDYALAYFSRGIVRLLQQDYDRALTDLEHGESILEKRSYSTVHNPFAITSLLLRALAHSEKGDTESAHRLWLEGLLPLDPRYRDPQWVKDEHQLMPALHKPLDRLLVSLPGLPAQH